MNAVAALKLIVKKKIVITSANKIKKLLIALLISVAALKMQANDY